MRHDGVDPFSLRCSGSARMSEGRQIFLIGMAVGAVFLDRHGRCTHCRGHIGAAEGKIPLRVLNGVHFDDRGLVDIVAGGATALGTILFLEAALVQTGVRNRYLIIGAIKQSVRAVEDLLADQMAAEVSCAGADLECSGLVGSVRISGCGSTIVLRKFPIGRSDMAL